jgi:hypothetical protein
MGKPLYDKNPPSTQEVIGARLVQIGLSAVSAITS